MGIDNRTVGSAIAQLRMREGMTQQQLAAGLNVTHQAVSKWENGAALPDVDTLLSLTQLFGVTMEQLLTGDLPESARRRHEDEQDEPKQSGFSRFMRESLPKNVCDTIEDVAAGAKKTVINIGETIAAKANEAINAAKESGEGRAAEYDGYAVYEDADERDERDECERDSESETARAANQPNAAGEDAGSENDIDIDKLVQMAPFMSRSALNDILTANVSKLEWRHLVRLAPFVSREVLDGIAQKLLDTAADRDIMRKLAPFLSSETVLKMVANNLDQMDWDTLRRMAPHLRRDVVDKLTVLLASGRAKFSDVKNNSFLGEVIGGTLNDINSIFSEIGGTVRSAFSGLNSDKKPGQGSRPKRIRVYAATDEQDEADEAPEAEAQKDEKPMPPKPSELKDKVARAALAGGNWDWLNAHLNEIGDRDLILEIALAAIKAGDTDDKHRALIIRAASLMDASQLDTLFHALLNASAWKTIMALKHVANESVSDQILERAADEPQAQRDLAYLTIKAYASKASPKMLETLTEKGLAEDNWQLINALTDSL